MPFEHGLDIAFYFAIGACLIAALASLLRGGRYVHGVDPAPVVRAGQVAPAGQVASAGQVTSSNGHAGRHAAGQASRGQHAL